ncbi:MAG: hypothetical protein B7Z14_15620, partial [Bosea sp. 32-68-6]
MLAETGQNRSLAGRKGPRRIHATPAPHRNRPQWRPPLQERKRRSEAGAGRIGRFFDWRFAHRKAWKKPRDIALRREDKAEALGLTYEEYSLEIMERGYHPQPEHVAAIKA